MRDRLILDLPESAQAALAADVADAEGNARLPVREAPRVILPTEPHRCRVCLADLPTGHPCVTSYYGARHARLRWYFCLGCSPYRDAETVPLSDRRAWKWAVSTLASAGCAERVPSLAWMTLDRLRGVAAPF